MFSCVSFNLSAERYGYATLTAHIINIVFVVLAEAAIVEKAIKCLDFTLTIVFFHIVLIWLNYGFPGWSQLNWWLINTGIVTVTCLLSEILCMKLETQEIKLSVDDLLASGRKVSSQIITIGNEVVEKAKSKGQGMGIAKKKKKKKRPAAQ